MLSSFKIIVLLLISVFLPATLLSQQTSKKTGSNKPVYHTVKPGETLFGISKKYSANAAEIRKWNKLKGNGIKAGQKLIVGYSKKKSAAIENKVEKKKVVPPQKPVKEIPPPLAKPVYQEKKKEKIVEPEAVPMKDISEEGIASWIDDEDVNTGKYYALHRTAPTGTIVKVSNTANQKSVYVKVVGKIPAREEFSVLIIQISKGASDKLEVIEARFNSVLNYSVPE